MIAAVFRGQSKATHPTTTPTIITYYTNPNVLVLIAVTSFVLRMALEV